MKIVSEGLPFIIVPLFFGTGIIIIWPAIPVIVAGAVLIVLSIFCLYFFRDPERVLIKNEEALVSPADGTVLEITDENGKKALRIFLSVFNVHLQRAPCKGTIKKINYIPGKFLPAMHPQAHSINEKNVFIIKCDFGEIILKQIAGIIARRVVSWVKEGKEVKQGEKIGFIRFGSQVDILVEQNVEIIVKLGDKVVAGETVIAWINNRN